MATHSSILAWRIPGTEEPGGLQSMQLQSQTQLSEQKHYMCVKKVTILINSQSVSSLASGSPFKLVLVCL